MLSEARPQPSLLFAENVALLSLLSRAATEPHVNTRAPSADQESPDQVLSPERETDLTSTLAFLCGISDNPSHVVATCVEEPSGRKGIRVLVAVNKEHPEAGNDILNRIKGGLEGIFRRLTHVNNEANNSLQDQVLDDIVAMCKHRIFSRLRSQRVDAKHMRKNKPFFGSILQQVFDALHKHPWSTQRRREIDRFLNGANALLQRMENLKKCRSEEVVSCIKSVLREARRLKGATNFDTLFSGITDRELAPTTRTGFISRIRKLTRYSECSVYLCRIAKALPLFKDAEITLVSLDAQLFARNLTGPHQCSLASSLSRFEGGVTDVASKLASLNVSNRAFTTAMQKALGKSSVHAEVQTVCYYELHPVARKPRVICSSKDACYLCNLFVQLHGMFHIPRTHGNLYPGWRLLPIPTLNHVQAQLNKTLETRITETVAKIMATKIPRLRLSLNENESTVFPFSTSLPTPASSVLLGDAQSTSGDSLRLGEQLSHGPESLVDFPFHFAAGGTAGPLPLGLESPPLSPLVRRQSRPATPEPPSPNSPKSPEARFVTPETRDEPARPDSEFVGGTVDPARGSSEQHVLANTLIPPVQSVQRSETQLEPKAAQQPRPTPQTEAEQKPLPLTIPTHNPASSITTPSRRSHPLLLARDQPLTLHLNTTIPSTPRLITAGPMTIHTEFIRSFSPSLSSPPSVPAKSVTVHIHWFPPRRAAAFRAARPLRGFVDLDRLRAGVEIDCGSAECVYLAYRGEVVVMDFVKGILA